MDDADDVALRLAQATRLDDRNLTVLVVDLGEVLAQATGRGSRVEVRLDDDATRDDVKRSPESEQGRHLGLAAARLRHRQTAELVLDLRCHGHRAILPRLVQERAEGAGQERRIVLAGSGEHLGSMDAGP